MENAIKAVLIAWATLTLIPADFGIIDIINTAIFSKIFALPLLVALIAQYITAAIVLYVTLQK